MFVNDRIKKGNLLVGLSFNYLVFKQLFKS